MKISSTSKGNRGQIDASQCILIPYQCISFVDRNNFFHLGKMHWQILCFIVPCLGINFDIFHPKLSLEDFCAWVNCHSKVVTTSGHWHIFWRKRPATQVFFDHFYIDVDDMLTTLQTKSSIITIPPMYGICIQMSSNEDEKNDCWLHP